MLNFSDTNKLGILLMLISGVTFFSSFLFFFDRSLALLANITFWAALYFLMGPIGTMQFFASRDKMQGSLYFIGGFFLIVLKLSLFGLPLQAIGLFYMFRKTLPGMFEWTMSFPGIGTWLSKLTRKHALVRPGVSQSRRRCRHERDLINHSYSLLLYGAFRKLIARRILRHRH